MRGLCKALAGVAAGILLVAGTAHSAELQVRLTGSDGQPVPFAVLTVLGVETAAAAPLAGAMVDQRKQRFDPLVTAITPGTPVTFPNSDDTRHHVYSFSEGNAFELKLYRANDAPPVAFNAAGIVTLGCNIHDSMKAYLYVSENASAVVSDAEGLARLHWEGDPTGVEVWHPQLAVPLQFSLPASDTAELVLELPIAFEDPQAGRTNSELETMLKRFSRDAN